MTSHLLIFIPAVLLVAAGFAGLMLPALPGAPLLFSGLVLAAWAEDFAYVGTGTMVALAVLALFTYVVDIVAGAFGAKRYGASTRSVVGATLGAVVGIFFGIPGVILGPFVGAVIGEFSVNPKLRDAGLAGWGATLGLLLGTAFKLSLAFTMVGIFLVMRFA